MKKNVHSWLIDFSEKTHNLRIGYLLAILILFNGCSRYDESLIRDFSSYHKLLPDQINTQIPVINIEVDQADFEYMYENFYDDIEIFGQFSLYRNRVLEINNLETRLTIKGGGSKRAPLKSLGVRFNSKQNNENRKLFNPGDILPGHYIDEIEMLRLRNSGNDFDGTMIKDISYTQLAIEAGLNLDLMYTEQSLVFVNRQFLGVMNIRSESNARGLAGLYKVDKERVTMGEVDGERGRFGNGVEVKDGDYEKIENLVLAVKNNNLNFLFREVDVDNFIDYLIFQSFIGNRDWPDKNVKFYAIDNGKFRFVLYDLDLCNTIMLHRDPQFFITRTDNWFVKDLYDVFCTDETFKKAFYHRFKELLESGHLSSGKFIDITLSYFSKIEDVMPYQIEKYNTPATMIEWYTNVDELSVNYETREKFVKKHILNK